MALGPEKFLKRVLEQDKLTIVSLEKKIDGEIEKKYKGEAVFKVDINEILSKRVIDEIKEKYIQAGWKNVIFHVLEGRFGEYGDCYFSLIAKQDVNQGYFEVERSCWVAPGDPYDR